MQRTEITLGPYLVRATAHGWTWGEPNGKGHLRRARHAKTLRDCVASIVDRDAGNCGAGDAKALLARLRAIYDAVSELTEDDVTQLSLMEPTPPAKTAREEWMTRLRKAIRERYRGQEITADEAVALMDSRPELQRPHHVSHHAMGSLFSGWDHARPVMVGSGEYRTQARRMSPRGNNPICVWIIE